MRAPGAVVAGELEYVPVALCVSEPRRERRRRLELREEPRVAQSVGRHEPVLADLCRKGDRCLTELDQLMDDLVGPKLGRQRFQSLETTANLRRREHELLRRRFSRLCRIATFRQRRQMCVRRRARGELARRERRAAREERAGPLPHEPAGRDNQQDASHRDNRKPRRLRFPGGSLRLRRRAGRHHHDRARHSALVEIDVIHRRRIDCLPSGLLDDPFERGESLAAADGHFDGRRLRDSRAFCNEGKTDFVAAAAKRAAAIGVERGSRQKLGDPRRKDRGRAHRLCKFEAPFAWRQQHEQQSGRRVVHLGGIGRLSPARYVEECPGHIGRLVR